MRFSRSFILLTIASIIVIAIINQYLFCPVYSFAKPTNFNGGSIYNPYTSIASNSWVKCIFHAHAYCWNGITNGHGTATDIHRKYTHLQYGVNAVSNYHLIDTIFHTRPNYVSAYEHGCNVLKNHQLVLGAGKVCWKDYYLPQTLSNKQDILNNLSAFDTSSLIIINHPLIRNGYRLSDFTSLTNYTCMEVLHPSSNSSVLWDAALSAGKPVFIVGNDDVHNIVDSNTVGRICTWVNTQKIDKSNIIRALRKGCNYAMTIGNDLMEQQRHGNNDSMPMLNQFTVKENQITVSFNLPAKEIIVSGQNGHLLKNEMNSNSISYRLGAQQPYARVTATFNNGTQIYLNPVFRYNKVPPLQSIASINLTQTLLLRILGVIVLLFWFNLVLKLLIPEKFQTNLLGTKNKYNHENNLNYTA